VEPSENLVAEPGAATRIRMGEVLRYPSSTAATTLEIDGRRNFYAVTDYPPAKALRLERGINQPKAPTAPEGRCVPVIAIASSTHRVGSDQTPWQDIFDVDNGLIRYFGDNKRPDRDPATSLGNGAQANNMEGLGKDLETLQVFVSVAGYYRGVMLVYGDGAYELPVELSQR
jgi:hypothetical protein